MSVEKTTEVSVELLGRLYARALHYEILKSYAQGVLTGIVTVVGVVGLGVAAAEAQQANKNRKNRKKIKESLRIIKSKM
jgi:hypothetical protein